MGTRLYLLNFHDAAGSGGRDGPTQGSDRNRPSSACWEGGMGRLGAQLAQPGDSPDVISVDPGDEHLPLVIIDE